MASAEEVKVLIDLYSGVRLPNIEHVISDVGLAEYYLSNFETTRVWDGVSQEECLVMRLVYHALFVIKGRWPIAEPTILTDGTHSGIYAIHALRTRWPEAEPLIKVSKIAGCYANAVFGGRWYEAEPFIMQDAPAAIQYAKNVIKGTWPEAEPNIVAAGLSATYKRETTGV